MPELLIPTNGLLLAVNLAGIFEAVKPWVLIFLGFSAVIFVHELGHFLVAKWAGVRIEKFCIGFGRELFGFTRGETRYGFNLLPLGGYVKMLGQEDFEVDSTGELQHKEDPRSFANKPVGHRMLIVSAGVIMNVIFAAILFMIVFTVGMEVVVTEVGFVKPNSPAALGGLQVGDQIRAIDGQKVNEFSEVNMAIVLAQPHVPLNFEVERDGQIKHLKILPENSEEKGVLMVGIGPAVTREIVLSPPGADADRDDLPKPGDKLVEVDGQPVTDENANELFFSMMNELGRVPVVTVERPQDPQDPASPTWRLTVEVAPSLRLDPSDPLDSDSINVLGLAPLMRFDSVEADGRAYLAGIKAGDIIARIAGMEYPTRSQITRAIREACAVRFGPGEEDFEYVERDIPLTVLRGPEAKELQRVVRPKVKRHLFGRNRVPDLQATYNMIAHEVLRVGGIVPRIDERPTPAAVAGIPAGALIGQVDHQPVANWIELVERLRAAAGRTVAIGGVAPDGKEFTADFPVPHELRTRMGLPIGSKIVSVDGDETVEVEWSGKRRTISVSHWLGLKTKLRQLVGKTALVRYVPGIMGEPQTAEVQVTEDMRDPWLGRIGYEPNLVPAQARKLFRTSNPIDAVGVGVKKTWYFVAQVYSMMKRMIFTRTVGVENLAGPVGIAKLGSDFASVGVVQLLFFLAIISANLAVINFLPLPIVDGGLMVFLLIEKVKGTPVSIKTQVVTQIIGLFLIIAAFLFVTYQDLQRLLG